MKANRLVTPVVAVVGLLLLTGLATQVLAQGLGVPVYSHTAAAEKKLRASAEKLRAAGKLVSDGGLTNQLNRKSCDLKLPPARTTRLSSRELWSVARTAHLRVGWYYLCTKCNQRHLNLAAGYAVAANGAVATCYHVVASPENMREGNLVVADENGDVFPVTEILAANQALDVCLLHVTGGSFKPLPLQTEVYPGDRCVCFSDPLGERGYFSEGIVSRFLTPRPSRDDTNAPPKASRSGEEATRLNVTTDWAPGSSGAAVLDESGNVIGHVTAIATLGDQGKRRAGPTLITLHEAVSAHDVLSLIRQP